MRPTSTGEVRARKIDPRKPPWIHPNYLSTEQDIIEFRNCIRAARQIFKQEAFDPFRGEELAPGPSVVSDSQIDAFVRAKSDSGIPSIWLHLL